MRWSRACSSRCRNCCPGLGCPKRRPSKSQTIHLELTKRLLKIDDQVGRLIATMQAKDRELTEARSAGRHGHLPQFLGLEGEVETFLYDTKNYLRTVLGIINVFFDTAFNEASAWWDPKHDGAGELVKWATARFGANHPFTMMLVSEQPWVGDIIQRRNAVEHPGGRSGTLHIAKLPSILTRSLREASTAVLNDLKKNRTEHRTHQELETENFKANLEWRWGVGIERLRMMLALGLEVGERYHKGLRKGKPSVLRGTLSHLHARTCQITAEIIALLEGGYANGALARWRTLHEIGVSAIARRTETQRRLRDLAFAYADIEDVPVAALRWEIVLDRTNARWRELLSLARLLLSGRFQTTHAGGSNGYSLLFEMSTLFEKYVARMLQRALNNSDLSVITQGGRLYCLETESESPRGLFQTRPDILIKRGNTVLQVIDTKWKRIGLRADDPKQGIAQSDIYQMMAYGRLYHCDRLTLLYPHHTLLGPTDGVVGQYRVTSGEDRLEVASINITRTEGMLSRLATLTPIAAFASR